MARADHLLRLVQVLRRYRQPVSAATLAEEVDVSIRSIYRDLQTLREQGASIEGEPGVGSLLHPGFLLPPLMLTEDELESIVLGLRLTAEHVIVAWCELRQGSRSFRADRMARRGRWLRAALPRQTRPAREDVGG